jgi:hypothetical protein
MSNLKKVFIAIVILVGLGTIAEGFNEAHHKELAKVECGSKANIEKVDSKGFECKKT